MVGSEMQGVWGGGGGGGGGWGGGGDFGQVPVALTYTETSKRQLNNPKYGLVNSSFLPHAKEFLRKFSATWAFALRNVRQHCFWSKNLKEYWFEGAPSN
jgi:hypothetical protein